MKLRHPLVIVVLGLALCVVVVVSVLVASDMMRRQRSIEKRDRVLELGLVGMPAEGAIEGLRAEGFKGVKYEREKSSFIVIYIDPGPHMLRSLAYSMDMNTDGIGPVMSVALYLDDEGNIERTD